MPQNRSSSRPSSKAPKHRSRDQRVDAGRKPASPTWRWTATVVAIGIAALALRLIYLAELAHSPFFSVLIGDGQEYDAWAQRIAGGSWLGTEAFYQAPLYPYLLAVVFKLFGHSTLLVRLLQAAGGAVSCMLLCEAGRRFVGPRAGAIAGALLAVYPEAIFFDGLIQKSSLDLLLLTSLIALAGICLTKPRWSWLAAAGVVLGAFMLNRENARVLYPVVAIWLIAGFRDVPLRRRLGWVAVFTAGAALMLLPVAARNYAVSGEILISTSQFGPNFYIGNHAGARGGYEAMVADHGSARFEAEDARQLAEQALGRRLSPGEISNYWFGRALDDIRRHPGGWLALIGRKLLMTINVGEFSDTESMQEYALYSALLRALRWLGFGLVLPLAAAGFWLTRGAWRRLSILYATFAALMLSVAIFYVFSRYRFPMVPVVLLFAAAALAALPSVKVEWRRWVPAGLAAVVVAVVCRIPLVNPTNDTHVNVGTELIRQGRPAEAIPVLQRAAAILPDDPVARFNLGVAFEKAGDEEAAIRELSEAVRLRQDDPKTRAALGEALQARGRMAEALQQFDQAVRLQPESSRFRLSYATALQAAGRPDAAIDQFREAVRAQPDDPVAQNDLAVALEQAGRTAEALPHYTKALALKPDYAEAHSNLAQALAETGQIDAAIDHFRTALRLQPGNYGTHANLGDLLLRLGRNEEAVAEYETAVRDAPDDVDDMLALLPRLAQGYAQAGRISKAIDTLRRGVDLARAAGRNDVAGRLAQAMQSLAGR
jgi:tetratricopeptide (TPR) repeat protein